MKLGILSRDPGLYSTRRLFEAAEQRGQDVRVVDYLRCYMNITSRHPQVLLRGETLKFDAVSGRNSLDNGLLLRSDIHALFDDHLLWIEPDSLTVSIALKLRSTTYAELEGQGLRPRIDGSVPNRQLLTDHMRNARTDA